jgi:hypothetical protein
VQDRTVVWSDAAVQKATADFVPVAVEVAAAMSDPGPAGEWFRGVAKQGHYGRTSLAPTQQGTYAVTPAGELLASGNAQEPAATLALCQRAKDAWSKLPNAARLPEAELAPMATTSFPADALALEVTMRRFFPRPLSDRPASAEQLRSSGLPRYLQRYAADKPETYWDVAQNNDHAWLTAAEARRFLPGTLSQGQRADVDRGLVMRCARLHMLDTVRALSQPYPESCVHQAELGAEVTAVVDGVAEVKFEGKVRLHQADLPRIARSRDRSAPVPQQAQRGYDAVLLGRAKFDTGSQRFVSFELVALGEKVGGSTLSAFDRTTMGVAFVLAPPDRAGRTAPRFLADYGW